MNVTCYHCSLEVPRSYQETLAIDGVEKYFCCPGCLAVTQLILQHGLTDYYQTRELPALPHNPLSELEQREIASYSDPALINELATTVTLADAVEDFKQLVLAITGISCAACVWLIEERLGRLAGIKKIEVNLMTRRAVVVWDNHRLSLSTILKETYNIGYKAAPFSPGAQEDLAKNEKQAALKRLAIAGLGAMQVMMFAVGLYAGAFQGMEDQYRDFLRLTSFIITTPVVFYSAWPFINRACYSILSKRVSMDVSVSLAIIIAYLASIHGMITQAPDVYFDSVCMFVFLLTLSKYFELRIRYQASAHLHGVHRLVPQTATMVKDEAGTLSHLRVLTKQLKVGERVFVMPGEAIPIDGIIACGKTTIDESLITGEANPVVKTEQEQVFAGSVNVDAAIEITVTAVNNKSFVAKLSLLVEQALAHKPQASWLEDWVAQYFTASILMIALAVFAYWHQHAPAQALMITLSVLIVACPCALALATPTAIVVATYALAKSGLLITKSHVLNTLAKCTDLIFDKTGTLTEGKFILAAVKILSGYTKDQCLAIACELEKCSLHPIAKAFVTRQLFNVQQLASQQQVFPGQGIEAVIDGVRYRIGQADFAQEIIADGGIALISPDAGAGWILLASTKGAMAWFKVEDSINDTAKACVQLLRQQQLQLSIISGDSVAATQQLAQAVHIADFIAAAKPQDKLAICQKIQAQGGQVIMVGDGVNDSPVMAQADVAIATHNGADITKTTADAYLLHGDLTVISQAVAVARRCQRIIKFNVTWAILYNFSAVPLAAMGLVPPYLAAVGMSLSSIIVVLNATRLHHLKT